RLFLDGFGRTCYSLGLIFLSVNSQSTPILLKYPLSVAALVYCVWAVIVSVRTNEKPRRRLRARGAVAAYALGVLLFIIGFWHQMLAIVLASLVGLFGVVSEISGWTDSPWKIPDE